MSEELYRLVKEAGDAANFSIILNIGKDNPAVHRKAKKAAMKFGEFAKWCIENDIKLVSGVDDLPIVGPASFIKLTDSNGTLMVLAAPHNIIEVEAQ